MKQITSEKTFEELMSMTKHDRVIYIYELLDDCKIKVMGDGRLFKLKNGKITQIKYGEMLAVYNRGTKSHD